MIQYAVISRGRARTITTKTLKALTDANVHQQSVTIFAHPSEAEEYRNHNPGWNVVAGGSTLTEQRTKVARHYPKGTQVVSCDDDVRRWATIDGDLGNMPLLAETMFETCLGAGANVWGVYPINNRHFMTPKIVSGLHFLIGQTFGFVSLGPEAPPIEAAPKGDWWMALQAFTADGVVLRINGLACASEMRGKGGIEHLTDDRRSMNRTATLKILERFGHLVCEKPTEAGQDHEIEVRGEVNAPFKSSTMDAARLIGAVSVPARSSRPISRK